MLESNISRRIGEIKEVFSDIKENIEIHKTNKLRKNSVLLKMCAPDTCGHGGCAESVRNRELELLARISELEAKITESGVNESNAPMEISGHGKALALEAEDISKKEDGLLKARSNEIRLLRREIAKMVSMNDLLKRDNIEMESTLSKYKDEMERLRCIEEEYVKQKDTIRKLKNEVMDLKGEIRVFCRIKPNIGNKPVANMRFSDEVLTVQEGSKKHEFLFDRIFGTHSTHSYIYKEIAMVVQSVLDGYKACIFAYGQTGSGKTYTMEGIDEDKGLIPMAITDIYGLAEKMSADGWVFEGTCTYVEIYNEEIIDLFANGTKKISVTHDNEDTKLINCTALPVNNSKEALRSFQDAVSKRRTGSTNCNLRSSRSHAVYTLRIKMRNESLGQHREGNMSLIDLAGSERLAISKSEGVRLKETQNINKSLSALGDVFNAILRKDSHIPFRNSKLTYLLQNFISGNSRTAIFVNVSSDLDHINETICSLRFADKVGKCKLGSVRRHVNNIETG